jgi:uroporphyrinogen III methyltransferase/synthase
VLVTREDPGPLAEAVAAAGGEPVLLPLLTTRWLPFELPGGATLDDYDWVTFTSVRGFEAIARAAERGEWGWPPQTRSAAVGDRTADELTAHGWMPECVAPEGTAKSLADCLTSSFPLLGARVLFPCSAIAEPTLPDALRAQGAEVDVLPVYSTVSVWTDAPERLPFLVRELAEALQTGCVVTCASGSAVRALNDLAFAAGLLEGLRVTPVAALGPSTAAVARTLGLLVTESCGRSLACLARKAVELGAARGAPKR